MAWRLIPWADTPAGESVSRLSHSQHSYNGPSDPDHSYAKEREHGMIKKNRKGAQYHGTQTVHSAV